MILLVDDDPAFLQSSETMLARDEPVYFAADANNARSLLSTIGAEFTVALVNVDLPGETGLGLIGEIRRVAPELPVIAISGHLQGSILETVRSMGAAEIVRKPLTSEWRCVIDRVRRTANV